MAAELTGVRPQALDVTEQLDAGVRYLDLRVAHVPEGSRRNLHFVHFVYTTALVEVRPAGASPRVPHQPARLGSHRPPPLRAAGSE